MKFLKFIFPVLLFLYSCAEYQSVKSIKAKEKVYYSSIGFALIYEDYLYDEKTVNKKMSNDEVQVMHNFLKINTPIKIINPENSKIVETKITKSGDHPKIFNIVITKKIASILELDQNNPYVEVLEIKKNKTFVAKKSNTFNTERNVADKVPIDEVKMDDLTKNISETHDQNLNKENFILVVSDFYYIESANSLKNDLLKKLGVVDIHVKKINNNKYRLFMGPFKNFNALKNTYISLNNLGFESLNIYKD